MKNIFLTFLLGAAITISSHAQEKPREFLSWYNGWAVHTIWGLGKISGSYMGTTVTCGKTFIPVRAIFDTHADVGSPDVTQSSAYAEAANTALLRNIEARDGKCEFQFVSQ